MYNLSTTVDPNKIFLIQRSELEERLDSTSYRPSFSFTSTKFRIEKLAKVAHINPKVSFDKLAKESEISFVPMEVINEFNGRIAEERFKKVEESKGFTRFAENDLIWAKITPCMQNGKSAVARNLKNGVACGSTEFFVIRPKSNDELLVDYIHFLLRDERVLKDAQNYFGGSAGQQRVSSEFLRNFKIPIPPIDVQHKIVGIINSAYATKQKKEAEAKVLLESIDTYLLGELGISLPEQDNSLEKRIFTKRYSELAGERLDSIFYASDLMRFYSGKYASVSLKSVSISFKSGIGAGKQDQAIDQNGIIQIRPTNIDENGLLKFDRNIYLPFEAKADTLDVGDVLFNNTNSQELVGKTAILKEQKELCYSNHITRIKVDQNKLVPDFLWVILNVYQKNRVFYSICTNWNNQSGIGLELLKSLKIPLPPLEKQTEIANHIQSIHSRAKALQHEATRVLEEAKREVEKMILGE